MRPHNQLQLVGSLFLLVTPRRPHRWPDMRDICCVTEDRRPASNQCARVRSDAFEQGQLC